MTTRREFVKAASLAPFAGLAPLQPCLTGVDRSMPGSASEEPVYAGRPLGYWLARVVSRDFDREVSDVPEQWMFRHFGDIAIPGLIEAMRDDSWFLAETELEMIATPSTIQALTHALNDKDSRVRHGAVSALYGIGLYKARYKPELVAAFRTAFPAIAEVLKTDEDEEVALVAAWILFGFSPWMAPNFSLPVAVSEYGSASNWATVVRQYPGQFSADQVVPELATMLSSNDAKIRLKAAQALSRFVSDHPGIVPIFVEHVLGREVITGIDFLGLDRIVENALPSLRQEFQNGSTKTRVSILHALAWSRSSIVLPILAEGLADEVWEIRAEATHGLSLIDSPEVVPFLIDAMQDQDRHVRRTARRGLANNDKLTSEALPAILNLLKQDDSTVQAFAALALIELDMETERAVLALQPILGNHDPSTRAEAAIAIARIDPGRSELVPILAEAIESEQQDLRNGAITALGRMGKNSAAVLPRLLNGIRQHRYSHDGLLGMLEQLGPDAAPAAPYLVELMAEPELGRNVPQVLGRIGEGAIPALNRSLRSNDLLVQSRAVRTLGFLGKPAKRFSPMLGELLTSDSPVLRIAAADALGNIGPSAVSALPALTEASRDRDIGVRVHAEQAMSRIGGRSQT